MATFRVEFSNAMIVNVPTGKALRCTRTLLYTHPRLGTVGDSINGCLFSRDFRTGGIRFTLPVQRYTRGGAGQVGQPTPDFIRMVCDYVEKSKYAKFITHIKEEKTWKWVDELDGDLSRNIGGLEFEDDEKEKEMKNENTEI